ncbi:MAG TPA: NAD-dependent succinate-semialdehyde dehydrogenase [Chryseolinea sp.]|nr:NAD-dependent succinate-semialdehyde dehydrogenase [Chryseolinea sp.]
MFKSINPYDQSVIAEFQLHSDDEIQKKLNLASSAYKIWRKESFSNRAALMNKVAQLLRQNKEEYARVITLEMGKIINESRGEIEKCAEACEYFAQHSEAFLSDTPIQTESKRTYITYQPTGAVFSIMPWNFPFWQVFRFAVPNIMAGNVVMLKHAPNVCQTSLLIEKIFHEAGFPEGVFQSFIIDVDKVEGIIRQDIVQGVTLTGSEKAGAQVAAVAGKHIKKSVLELGGSDAFIVLDDADLERAAIIAIQSRMRNAGQVCIAAKRFIVVEKVKEEFLNHLQKNISALIQGNPLDEKITVGPMARLDLAETLEKQMGSSIQSGARRILGGERNGCNYQPALLDNVKPGMVAFEEETFGPLASIITVKNESEAIALANTSRYGLSASLWTNDLNRAAVLAKEIEAGAVFVNSLVRSDPRWPIGGIKKSGYGRELAEAGIKEFINAKSVIID